MIWGAPIWLNEFLVKLIKLLVVFASLVFVVYKERNLRPTCLKNQKAALRGMQAAF